MRRPDKDGTAHTPERTWLRCLRALVHLGVVLGGAIGLQQVGAPAAAAALNDGPAPAKTSLARDSARLPLADRGENDSDALESSSEPPALALRGPAQSASRATFVPSFHVERPESTRSAHAYEARAPPRHA
jgi:hypothetical protein